MSNLDTTFDNAYEYDYSDSKGSYHCIKNNDVGLRIGPGNNGAVFYDGNDPKAQNFYFYPLGCDLEGIDRYNSSVTAHFKCSYLSLLNIKNTVQNNDLCDHSNICNDEMKGLHFKFK